MSAAGHSGSLPRKAGETAAGAPPPCPFCGSGDTELFSLFGSSALTSQYYCRGCRTAFEQVKWGTVPPDTPPASPPRV